MKNLEILTTLSLLVVLLWWHSAAGVPQCTKVGYNENLGCEPYGGEEGWYSYCYQSNGRWIAHPYRCALVDPQDVAAEYKQFKTDKCVAEPEVPITCEDKGGLGQLRTRQ